MSRPIAVLVTALLAASLLAPAHAGAVDEGARLTGVSPTTIDPPRDFTSRLRGYWWDFESTDHFGWNWSQSGWASPRLAADGWFIGRTTPLRPGSTTSDAAIFLNELTEPETIPVAEVHADTPFDPRYRWLNVRMCATFYNRDILGGREPSRYTFSTVSWHRDALFSSYEWGVTKGLKVYEGCRTYRFDLVGDQNPNAAGSLPWTAGGFTALRFRPATHPDIQVVVDYVTLSPAQKGEFVNIAWEDNGQPVRLFFSSSSDLSRLTTIPGRRTGGSFDWRTPNLAPGTYYVVAQQAGRAAGTASFRVDAPPQGRILTPSFTSGPDYATEARGGDAWDMSQPGDVSDTRNLRSVEFANGQLRAVSTNIDPGIHLTVNGRRPIDPDRYYYLTYRMWVADDGEPGRGSVVRALWWTGQLIGDKVTSTTEDVRDYGGWQEVTIDLRGRDVLEERIVNQAGVWGTAPVLLLRLDPHESADPTPVRLDWVTLTGNDGGDRRFRIRYEATDPEGKPLDIRFFFDDDADRRNGRTFRRCRAPSAPGVCEWATGRLPEGEYFVHMRIRDAAGNITWATSEAPFEIRHRDYRLLHDPIADLRLLVTTDLDGADPATTQTRLFYGTNPDPRTRTPVECRDHPDPAICVWRTSGLAEGDYHLYLRVEDRTGEVAWVTSPVSIRHDG
jgi:hypothetical protein